MKVTLEKDYRRFYTLEDMDHAKEVIKCEKDDESTVKSWAVYAANEALKHYTGGKPYDYFDESGILQASARTAKNRRVWNLYGETGNMDVWIDFTAWSGTRFIVGGAYLSDIFNSGPIDYGQHMYYRVFEETK